MNIIRRNAVTVKGNLNGRTLLFAHGYGCNQEMWRFLTPYFEDQYKIVLFDHIGCGNSDSRMYNRFRYQSLSGYANDVIELCEYLEIKDAVLVCHSVSCMIGILATILKPAIFQKIILIGPSPYFINDGEYKGGFEASAIEGLILAMESNYTGWSDSITPVIMQNPQRPELTVELNTSFCSMDRSIAKDFGRLTFTADHRMDLIKVSIPTLVIQCSEDPITPDFVGWYVHQNIKGSNFIRLKATGHCPHLSEPAETANAIKLFL